MEENKKKNNKVIIGVVIAIIVIVAVAGIAFAIYNNSKPKSNVQITSTQDMENLINTVYEGQEDDISNIDIVTSYTGLTANENIDGIVVSEPMMSSQAYSFVLVKVKDGANADAIAKEMSEKVDTRKWICVEAEKLYATSVDNLAVLVMSSDEWATPVYNKLKEVLGAHNEEYVKDNSSAFEDQSVGNDGIINY